LSFFLGVFATVVGWDGDGFLFFLKGAQLVIIEIIMVRNIAFFIRIDIGRIKVQIPKFSVAFYRNN